jgi:hypothetical protein
MSAKARDTRAGRSVRGAVLALALACILIGLVGCEGLGTTTESATASTAEVAVESEASLWGVWEGTYTPLEAWDEDGTVADPPVELGVPVSLILDLHPLPGAGGDYGTLTAGGFGAARVTALFFDGQDLELTVVSEMEDRDDYHSVITGTLGGDVITGEDSGDPDVPSGWVSTSGTLHLTRSTSPAPSDTGATPSTEAGSGEPSGGSSGDDDGAFHFEGVIPVDEQVIFEVGEDDNNHTMGLHVGDRVRIEFSLIPQDEVTEVGYWHEGDDSVQPVAGSQGSTDMIGWVIRTWIEFEAVAPGHDQIGATYIHGDGSVSHPWVIYVAVIE